MGVAGTGCRGQGREPPEQPPGCGDARGHCVLVTPPRLSQAAGIPGWDVPARSWGRHGLRVPCRPLCPLLAAVTNPVCCHTWPLPAFAQGQQRGDRRVPGLVTGVPPRASTAVCVRGRCVGAGVVAAADVQVLPRVNSGAVWAPVLRPGVGDAGGCGGGSLLRGTAVTYQSHQAAVSGKRCKWVRRWLPPCWELAKDSRVSPPAMPPVPRAPRKPDGDREGQKGAAAAGLASVHECILFIAFCSPVQ